MANGGPLFANIFFLKKIGRPAIAFPSVVSCWLLMSSSPDRETGEGQNTSPR